MLPLSYHLFSHWSIPLNRKLVFLQAGCPAARGGGCNVWTWAQQAEGTGEAQAECLSGTLWGSSNFWAWAQQAEGTGEAQEECFSGKLWGGSNFWAWAQQAEGTRKAQAECLSGTQWGGYNLWAWANFEEEQEELRRYMFLRHSSSRGGRSRRSASQVILGVFRQG